jgi:hypothetical protein
MPPDQSGVSSWATSRVHEEQDARFDYQGVFSTKGAYYGCVTPRAPFKVRPVDADVDPLYHFNEGFESLVTDKEGGSNPYWVQGRLCFPEPTPLESSLCKKDGSYFSFFGPCIADSGVVYKNSNHNVSLGLQRLTKVRVPLLIGYDQYLQSQQEHYISTLTPFISDLQSAYSQTFFGYSSMIEECEDHHADPHQKKAPHRCETRPHRPEFVL